MQDFLVAFINPEMLMNGQHRHCQNPFKRRGFSQFSGRGSRIFQGEIKRKFAYKLMFKTILTDRLRIFILEELPKFYGTRRFITVLTTPRHWSLS
jgi:hypothetical protein